MILTTLVIFPAEKQHNSCNTCCLRTAAELFWETYLWQNISSLLPGHAGGGVQLVGLDGHDVMVVAEVPGSGRHAKVIPRWQFHSLCGNGVIFSYWKPSVSFEIINLLRHKEPRRACWQDRDSQSADRSHTWKTFEFSYMAKISMQDSPFQNWSLSNFGLCENVKEESPDGNPGLMLHVSELHLAAAQHRVSSVSELGNSNKSQMTLVTHLSWS